MTPAETDHVLTETMVRCVEFRTEMTSTNDVAIQLAKDDVIDFPTLVITNRQTGGRGRGSNQWWAADGSLTFSLVLDAPAIDLPQQHWPKMSLTIGLSVCETIEYFTRDRRVQLKWPNDVFLERKKVCGVLVETISQRPGIVVVGVGINVNNSFSDAPVELQAIATSMSDAAVKQFAMTDVLVATLQCIERRIHDVVTDSGELTEAWRSKCFLEGRTVCIDLGVRQVSGLCQGIDHDGALLIQSDGGIERLFAGVVTQIL